MSIIFFRREDEKGFIIGDLIYSIQKQHVEKSIKIGRDVYDEEDDEFWEVDLDLHSEYTFLEEDTNRYNNESDLYRDRDKFIQYLINFETRLFFFDDNKCIEISDGWGDFFLKNQFFIVKNYCFSFSKK